MENKPHPFAAVRELHPSLPVGGAAGLIALARQKSAALRTPDFEIDLLERCVRYPDGEEVRFTPHQWRVLEALVLAAPSAVTRATLTRRAFGPDGTQRDVALLVAQLRRKLEPDHHVPCYLLAVGRGDYAFNPGGGHDPGRPPAIDRDPRTSQDLPSPPVGLEAQAGGAERGRANETERRKP